MFLKGENLSLKCCHPLKILTYFKRGFRSFHTANIGSLDKGQLNFKNDSNLIGIEPGQTDSRGRAIYFFCDLQLWQLVTLQLFDQQTLYLTCGKTSTPPQTLLAFQGVGIILRVGFTLMAYLVTVRFILVLAVKASLLQAQKYRFLTVWQFHSCHHASLE